ncbi:MAG: DUF255 domain-containing protein [Phycisphaeraceae bacterium]|nr:DUF255 domain-containing protein [Phycisphaeraceae bacterium]
MTTTPSATAAGDTDTGAHAHTNALIHETSPYLLQHAHNPVDWKPWGRAAFDEARERGVPIFLSIGYSTCYWCHVMERESFEDEATARVMNERFVCVKVDREERPDVDDIYMAATQTLTGGGGWPMSVWLTPPGALGEDDPGLRPFYAGTYFPPEDSHGRPSLTRVLMGISDAWTGDRAQVLRQARSLTDAVRERLAAEAAPVKIGREQIVQGVQQLLQSYDNINGGFGGAPKFPQPVFLEFLMQIEPRITDPQQRAVIRDAVTHTLDRMAVGGVFDQVGGGFHRYSVDAQWTVPHFEKMLYDNAQLAILYTRSAEDTGDAFHERIARRTLDYVLHEMTGPGGAFFSAQDAEVNAHEGQNYLWRLTELAAAIIDEGDIKLAADLYGLAGGANFRDPHNPDTPPANVLRLSDRPDVLAQQRGMPVDELLERLDSINARLYAARAERDQPGLDDKAITAWNGLMIAALAEAGAAFDEPRYTNAAHEAAAFILDHMIDETGALRRTSRDGVSKSDGLFDDYSFFISGLLALERAGVTEVAGRRTLDEAIRLTALARQRFGDPDSGGYFDTPPGRTDLIVRARTTYDGVIPSAVSVMIHNLLDLSELTRDRRWLDEAAGAMASISQEIARSPVGAVNATRALDRILALDAGAIERAGMTREVRVAPETPPVEIYADTERIELAPGEPRTITLNIRVREGYHVNAHEPGVEGLIGLMIDLTGGSGVVADINYPRGVAYHGAAVEQGAGREQLLVYEGDTPIEVTLSLDESGAITGRPRLRVIYQACDDAACYEPRGTVLEVEIVRAATSEQ